MVEIFEIPVPLDFGVLRRHRPDHLGRGVVVETVGAVPGLVQLVGAVDTADDVAANLCALVEMLLADVGHRIEIELGQQRRGGSLLDVTVFGSPERRFLRQGGNGVLEQGFDMGVGLARRAAGAQVVVHRVVNGHAAEIVEAAHVEVGRDGIQLVDVVGLDGVVEPDGVVIDPLEVGLGFQGTRNTPGRTVVGIDDEAVVGRPGVVMQAVVLAAVIPVAAALGAHHLVGGQLLEVPPVGTDVPFPVGEGTAKHGIGAFGRGEERIGGDFRVELLVEVAGRRAEGGSPDRHGNYMFQFHNGSRFGIRSLTARPA